VFVKSLKINNLRNLNAVEIDTHPKLNLLIGPNGAGKTSVLESLVVLAKGRTFRGGSIASLIGPAAGKLTIFAATQDHLGKQRALGIERDSQNWAARMNGQDVMQLGDLAIHMPMVIMEPNSHLLISGPPDGRRRFLDWGVFHVEPGHLLHWRRYSRSLKQRNAALRRKQLDVIRSLDPVLSELGEKIDAARRTHFDRLIQSIAGVSATLSPQLPGIEYQYSRGWGGSALIQALRDSTERDIERGQTTPGPHRSDILFGVTDQAAKDQLSRGEQKILAASLLLSQALMLAEQGNKPLLLLDDIASEFDKAHLAALMDFAVKLDCQTWVTGTSLDPFRKNIPENHALFHVEQGQLSHKTNA